MPRFLTAHSFRNIAFICAVSIAAPLVITAHAQTSAATSLTPDGETLRLTYAAVGVQIYECKITEGKAAWAFIAPEADLFDASGKRVGKHYAGPSWESDDGSKIVGTVRARADAPRAGAIPHLLLAASADAKAGALAAITSVQRVNTLGGVAPATPCAAGDSGKQARVYYSADYKFFSK
jgi:hypothetical protein